MDVSRNRDCEPDGRGISPEERAALGWLQRQLAWEQVLGRLRRQAGVESPPSGPSGQAGNPGRGQDQAA